MRDELAAALQGIKDAAKAEKTKDAEESGKFEHLYNEEKAKREQSELAILKRDVEIARGLPQDFVVRLQRSNNERA